VTILVINNPTRMLLKRVHLMILQTTVAREAFLLLFARIEESFEYLLRPTQCTALAESE
jgi:hypothetical protein